MPQATMMQLFKSRLPVINDWIDEVIAEYQSKAVLLGDLPFKRIPQYLSDKTLASVKMVITNAPPRPPMRRFGFMGSDRELDGMAIGDLEMRGATIDQLCFIGERFVSDEQFPFHQVIHALQWKTQGRETWLTNYAYGVFTLCRADTWAEKQAGKLQRMFAQGQKFDAESLVRDELNALAQLRGFPFA